jgi:hypothetical protein
MVDPVIIRIRGVTYPSMADAARAIGVTPRAITHALDRGKIDEVGLHGVGPKPKPVTVGGITFARKRDLAKALGKTVEAIVMSLKRGPRAIHNLECYLYDSGFDVTFTNGSRDAYSKPQIGSAVRSKGAQATNVAETTRASVSGL